MVLRNTPHNMDYRKKIMKIFLPAAADVGLLRGGKSKS